MNREPDRNQRKALGKGLSALLPARIRSEPAEIPESSTSPAPAETASENSDTLHLLPIDQVESGEGQPRNVFDDAKLRELAQSIQVHGLIQPITVYQTGEGRFRIVAGERRWRAAQMAGLSTIPALLRSVDRDNLLELALIENIQREDLNPIEIAEAFQKLTSEHSLTHEQIAERTGKDRSTVTNFLRLLKLSPAVRKDLIAGEISMGHARALLNITNLDHQENASETIKRLQLSVRATEQLVRDFTKAPAPGPRGAEPRERVEHPPDANVRAALDEMAMALGTKVRLVKRSETAGRLEIDFYSQEDLDRIYSVIVKE